RDLPRPPRRAARRAAARRLARGEPARDDVPLGADPRAVPRARVARVLAAAAARGEGLGESRRRLRPRWRRPRALRARRERAADRAGDPRHPPRAARAPLLRRARGAPLAAGLGAAVV